MIKKVMQDQTTATVLLSVITILCGVSLWFAYTFAQETMKIQTAHEVRLDNHDVEIATLKAEVKARP